MTIDAQTPTPVQEAAQALADDHHRLQALVAAVREAPDLAVLASAAATLHAALSAHFRDEENPDGLYDMLGACVPAHAARVAALVDEHYRLLARARQLADAARGALTGPFLELKERAWDLSNALARHEADEHELVKAVTPK
jgi:hypothetical protein